MEFYNFALSIRNIIGLGWHEKNQDYQSLLVYNVISNGFITKYEWAVYKKYKRLFTSHMLTCFGHHLKMT